MSTSGLASRAPGHSFCGILACIVAVSHRQLEMLSIRKPGATNINLWTGSTIQKPEVLSRVPEMVQNVVKLTVI